MNASSNTLDNPRSIRSAISILYSGNRADIGISMVFSKSNMISWRKSLYSTFSNGRNVSGKLNVVPGLNEIILGKKVVKYFVCGGLN